MDFLREMCGEERIRTVFEQYYCMLLHSMNIIILNVLCNSNMATFCDSRSEYFPTKYLSF